MRASLVLGLILLSAPAIADSPPTVGSGLVTVRFFTRGDGFTHLRLDDQKCLLPCTLLVHPGVHHLVSSGREVIVTNIEIPDNPTSEVELRARTPTLTTVGGIMIVLGAVMASTMWLLAATCPDSDVFPTPCQTANLVVWPLLGGGVLFTGIGLLIAGLTQEPTARVRWPFPWEVTGLGVVPLAGGATANLRLSF